MFTQIGSFSRRLFLGHADFFSHADFADDADFSLMLFLFPTDFKDLHRFLTCLVLDFADFRPARSWMTQILYKNWAAQSNDGQPSLILFVFTVITRFLL